MIFSDQNIRNVVNEFIKLDTQKIQSALSKEEYSRWSELHELILKRIYNLDQNILLDNRNYIRLPVFVKVLVKFGLFKKKETMTRDLSIKGMGLPIQEGILLGDKVRLILPIQWDTQKKEIGQLKMTGLVRWMRSSDDCMGIEFLDISSKDRAILMRYIHALIIAAVPS